MGQQRPNDACIFVSQRDSRHILVSPIDNAVDPTAGIRFLRCSVNHRAHPMNQQSSEIGITPFTDSQQILFAATGVLFGHQSQPGCNLAATIEVLCVAQRGYQCACRDRADAWNFRQFAAGITLAMPLHDLLFQLVNLAVKFLEVI